MTDFNTGSQILKIQTYKPSEILIIPEFEGNQIILQ